MIYKPQAQSGFRRDSMWCGPAAHAVMPSPAVRNERGACTFTLSGQRSRSDERYGLGILGRRHIELGRLPYGGRKFGHPCAEKVRPHRARQFFFTPADPAVGVWARLTSDAAHNPAATDWLVVGRGRDTVRVVPAKDAHRAFPVAGVKNYRCAPRSVRHHERPLPWKASRLRDPSAGFWQDVPEGHRSGGSEHRQGTLTITGSNVRLGTEMPVALSLFP